MIKLVLFDLDGVLIDAKEIHYEALNKALGPEHAISRNHHINVFDGLPTLAKLKILARKYDWDSHKINQISEDKQKYTIEMVADLKPVTHIVDLFKQLSKENYKIGVCTNSVRKTVLTALAKTELMEYVDIVLSNEDVKNSKPHPEIYWKAMSIMGTLPENTLIVEDSPKGLLSAARSKAKYIRVDNPYDVTREKVFSNLKGEDVMNKWKSDKLNVLIPMAGAGSRFAQAGYTFPKPLIQVHDKPMIQLVTENLGLEANFIYVVQKEHREKYNLDAMLNLIAPNCKVIEVDGITEGAACTALLAKEFIDNDDPLFFANSDQYVDWNPVEFMYNMQETNADGGIVTFKATHPKWSYAKVNEYGKVTEVAEKNPISNNATVGYYYWKHGSDFVKYAEQMIEKDIRVNNEFYVCPVFNEAIEDNKTIRTYDASGMWGLGTPEDLDYYINHFERN
tara:strand:+ start:437 stop:1789 length:1353 start_codon:yes stop_codon:yes gene_type:complete